MPYQEVKGYSPFSNRPRRAWRPPSPCRNFKVLQIILYLQDGVHFSAYANLSDGGPVQAVGEFSEATAALNMIDLVK